jgi:hypothetical protein
MKYVIFWTFLAIVFAFGIGGLNLPRFYRLTKHGVLGQASAVRLAPENHCTVYYQYQVGGRTYHSQGQSWMPNPPLGDIAVGQKLVIYYDPENPSVAVLGNPKSMLKNEVISVGLATIAFPTFIVLAIARRKSSTRLKTSSFRASL